MPMQSGRTTDQKQRKAIDETKRRFPDCISSFIGLAKSLI
jgi:hypothetical protein